ncbi:predicted protein, partial [Nematostella vectensis]
MAAEKAQRGKEVLSLWHHQDISLDSIYGISLEKWYAEKPKQTKREIIVATLDTQIDLDHEDLQGQFWVNKKEIPNNGIDDDNNGYIDDVNGWNFIGTKSGNYTVWGNFEYVRFVRKWESAFEGKKKEDIENQNLYNYNTYNWAAAMLDYTKKYYNNRTKSLDYSISVYAKAKDTLKYYFPKEDYNYEKLDSLYNEIKGNDNRTYKQMLASRDADFLALVYSFYSNYANNTTSLTSLLDDRIQMDSLLHKNLNVAYNERDYIGDNPEVLEKGYGNNKINAKIEGIRSINTHNTEVSSVIASLRFNGIGTDGFSNNIKIMPLTISPLGDEHDKDIAMAIYYAVDNGAKVINMSFGKEFSLNREWVLEAMQYAERHNVLLVHCSGNDANNIDNYPDYPNDIGYGKSLELVNNFINVGSISKRTDSTMVTPFSNYGKNNVDLFAPGEEIYVAIPDNQYTYDSGTSLAAPMVSGTAALIWLYYPNLTVQEVKNIILESGVTIDKMVVKPGTKNEMVHFSELCKTGKVLNTYNAMKMAAEKAQRGKEVLSLWHHQDISLDSIYGIYLEKWYAEKPKKTNQEIIVATIDSQIDLDHEDLQGQFWVSKKEIPNNGIDDDNNGYIDDINGWNFIGIDNEKTLAFCNFEFVRYINVYKQKYEKEKIENKNKYFLDVYERALKKYKSENKYYSTYLKVDNMLISAYYPAKDSLRRYFPKEDYTLEKLDSLYQIHKENDKTLKQRLNENDE